ncbi:MAG: hypothetical protein QCI00_06835, partial [Candidatus Thermoplasmatota archaeon]|nr:hypothetical protein [Candidatus Thermoplasmatota archaeon]
MAIKNVQLKVIKAERYSDFTGGPQKVRIDHNSNVVRMEILSEVVSRVEFQYTASYGPIGVIKIEGTLEYEGEQISSLVNDWRSNRKMPDDT